MINTDINCHFNELAEHYLTYLAMFSQESWTPVTFLQLKMC
jgi:hypothetical protein